MRRLSHSHSLGGGLVLGLVIAQRPLWIFAAGIVVGVGLVLAVRVLRRLLAGVKLGGRALARYADGPAGAPTQEGENLGPSHPPADLTEAEREAARREGLRQGEAAGIRAAARLERREQARRDEMADRLEEHWRDERRRSLERVTS